MNLKKVYVTGCNGMLGYDVVAFLNQKDVRVEGCDIDNLDLRDKNKTKVVISKSKPDVLINCAAYTNVDGCESNIEEAFDINGNVPGYLSEICKELDITLVHISTDFLFDGNKASPYIETDTLNPLSMYGKSKLEGENRIIHNNLKKYFIIRTSWLYGLRGKNFVKTIIRLLNSKETFGVVYDQVGTPTFTQDLACSIYNLINTQEYGIYHFSNEGVCSWYDFAYEIFLYLKDNEIPIKTKKLLPIETKDYVTPAIRPRYSVLNKLKYKNVTKCDIPYWKESLRYFLDKYLNDILKEVSF